MSGLQDFPSRSRKLLKYHMMSENYSLKTLSEVRVTVGSKIIGVIIARVALAGGIILPGSRIQIVRGGSLHENEARLRSRGHADLLRSIAGRAPWVHMGLCFSGGKNFFCVESLR